MPWDEVLAALKDIDYSGPFSLEAFTFYDCFRDDELPLALELASRVGKSMIAKLTEQGMGPMKPPEIQYSPGMRGLDEGLKMAEIPCL